MSQSQLADLDVLESCAGSLACVTAEYDDVEQRVAHQSVCAVNTACDLACCEEVLDTCLAVRVDLDTAVLIVQCRIDKDRLLCDIDAALLEHTVHSRDSLLDCALAVLDLDDRSVKPYAVAVLCLHAVALRALADDGSSLDVTGLKRVNEDVAILVDDLRAERTNLLCNERAVDLIRECSARRMILQRVLIEKLCACSVAEDKTISCCAVVVRCREALIMHTARTACSKDDRLRADNDQLHCLHVEEDSACRVAILVLDDFNRGGELDDRDLTVQNLIAECTHDLHAGVIAACVHSLAGCSAAVCRDHAACLVLIKLATEIVEPLNVLRSLCDELCDKLLLRHEMAAAVRIKEMLCRGVVLLVSSLDAALSHHCVRITGTKLCGNEDLCAGLICLDRRRAACSAAADDQDIDIICRMLKIDIALVYTRMSLQHISELVRSLLALVRADLQLFERVLVIIRMILSEQLILLVSSHASRLSCCICLSLLRDLCKRFLKTIWIHIL